MLLLYTYLILFIYSTVYPSYQHSEGGPKRTEYIPKRIKNKGMKNRIILTITKLKNTCIKYLQKLHDMMMNHIKVTHRKRIAKNMSGVINEQNWLEYG